VTGEFSLGCQALQDCVILSQSPQHKKPNDHPPCSDGKLNVLQALELALPCFDFSYLQNAYRFATKKSEFPTKNGQDVLKEAVYSLELVSVLRSWLPLNFRIIPEASCERKEADILISNRGKNNIVLEILANERFGPESRTTSMCGHISRAADYANSLKATAWVIHFVEVYPFPTHPDFPDLPKCDCVYIFHTQDWSKIQFSTKLKDGKTSKVEWPKREKSIN